MTNYEMIVSMTPEEMAVMFTELIKSTQNKLFEELSANNISFTLMELADDVQVEIHRQWLEMEVGTH
jgi:Mg/Co/Ni transporter MgtE